MSKIYITEWCAGALIIVLLATATGSAHSAEPDALLEMMGFLDNDTSDHQHRPGSSDYHCMHRSVDLAQNMTEAGYAAGCVLESYPHKHGHMIVWAHLGGAYNETVYIEGYYDQIYDVAPYTGCFPDAKFVEIDIDHAQRLLHDQERWLG